MVLIFNFPIWPFTYIYIYATHDQVQYFTQKTMKINWESVEVLEFWCKKNSNYTTSGKVEKSNSRQCFLKAWYIKHDPFLIGLWHRVRMFVQPFLWVEEFDIWSNLTTEYLERFNIRQEWQLVFNFQMTNHCVNGNK